MEQIFPINSNDGDIVTKVKIEANIKLASISKNPSINRAIYQHEIDRFTTMVEVAKLMYLSNVLHIDKGVSILNDLLSITKGNPLSPLTLNDDEFKLDDTNEFYHVYENIRYNPILKYINVNIPEDISYYNSEPFNSIIKTAYDNVKNKEVILKNYINLRGVNLYITKGGVTTGEVITYKHFRIDITKDFSFITTKIDIPVSIIIDNNQVYYTVDARDPNLKKLIELYNVTPDNNTDIKGYIDIRKYEKLIK